MATHPLHWRFKVQKTLLLNRGSNLGSKPSSVGGFVRHNATASFSHRVQDGLSVPGKNRHQVNHLATYPQLLLSQSSNLPQNMNLSAPAYQRNISSLHQYICLPQGTFIVLCGHLLHSRSVQDLGLKENTGVLVPDTRKKKALGL